MKAQKNTEWSISVHWGNARKQVEEEVLNKYEVRAEERRISRNICEGLEWIVKKIYHVKSALNARGMR